MLIRQLKQSFGAPLLALWVLVILLQLASRVLRAAAAAAGVSRVGSFD